MVLSRANVYVGFEMFLMVYTSAIKYFIKYANCYVVHYSFFMSYLLPLTYRRLQRMLKGQIYVNFLWRYWMDIIFTMIASTNSVIAISI